MNGWSIPAVWIFIVAQASAAVWWASGTDTQVGQNSTSIVQVIQNEKQIAVMGAQPVSYTHLTLPTIYSV